LLPLLVLSLLLGCFCSSFLSPVLMTWNFKGVHYDNSGYLTSCNIFPQYSNSYWIGAPGAICNPGYGWDNINLQMYANSNLNVGSLFVNCSTTYQPCEIRTWAYGNNCNFSNITDITVHTAILNICYNFSVATYLLDNTIGHVSRIIQYRPQGVPHKTINSELHFKYFPNNTRCEGKPLFSVSPKIAILNCYEIPGFGSLLYRACQDSQNYLLGAPLCGKARNNPSKNITQCSAVIQYCPYSNTCQGTTDCFILQASPLSAQFVQHVCYTAGGQDSWILGCQWIV